ncbi:hypothetical protein K440DRAFT_638283 [Wilcoxina mikolae CBS 423.85]|nr:hypothetical protein K440DRAFT_638283 [Wilcoxina mikolae CBS 423.85]
MYSLQFTAHSPPPPMDFHISLITFHYHETRWPGYSLLGGLFTDKRIPSWVLMSDDIYSVRGSPRSLLVPADRHPPDFAGSYYRQLLFSLSANTREAVSCKTASSSLQFYLRISTIFPSYLCPLNMLSDNSDLSWPSSSSPQEVYNEIGVQVVPRGVMNPIGKKRLAKEDIQSISKRDPSANLSNDDTLAWVPSPRDFLVSVDRHLPIFAGSYHGQPQGRRSSAPTAFGPNYLLSSSFFSIFISFHPSEYPLGFFPIRYLFSGRQNQGTAVMCTTNSSNLSGVFEPDCF